ncbi:MAG TPA: thiamine phosphate synthase [Sphingobacteriaceae bacterium]
MKKYISNFHYITHDHPYRSHVEQTEIACEAGANWIQYRCFSKPEEEMINEIHQVAAICDDWGATLILADHYQLLDKVDAQGVHIEDLNADLKFIRDQITDEKTFGTSATSFIEIQRIAASGVVDYIGCGPFSTTLTKPNDYPLMGVEGYRDIISKMKESDIDIPLLAVGGVKIDDVTALMKTGIFGIAVSGAVNIAEDPAQAVNDFRSLLR